MALRTRHTVTSQSDVKLKQAQKDLERALLELDAIVFPENYGNAENLAALSSTKVEKLTESIRYNIRELESLIPSERDPAKRELSRKRLEASLQRLQELENRARAKGASWAVRARLARERDQLLSKKDDFDAEAATELTAAVAESESLKHSSRGVDEIMGIGRAVLESLGSQTETLRRATDRVESVAGSLGLSNSLLRAVRRRQFGDAMIVYGGMVTVVLILFLFYRWVHSIRQ